MKKVSILVCLASLLMMSCKIGSGDTAVSIGMVIRVDNETEESYECYLYGCDYDRESFNKDLETGEELGFYVNSEDSCPVAGNSSRGYALVDSLINRPENQSYIFIVKDKNSNVIYKACGWPEEWKTSVPDGWKIPDMNFNKYGIGFVNVKLNDGSKNLFYLDSDGNKKEAESDVLCYTLTIKGDGNITLEMQ